MKERAVLLFDPKKTYPLDDNSDAARRARAYCAILDQRPEWAESKNDNTEQSAS